MIATQLYLVVYAKVCEQAPAFFLTTMMRLCRYFIGRQGKQDLLMLTNFCDFRDFCVRYLRIRHTPPPFQGTPSILEGESAKPVDCRDLKIEI